MPMQPAGLSNADCTPMIPADSLSDDATTAPPSVCAASTPFEQAPQSKAAARRRRRQTLARALHAPRAKISPCEATCADEIIWTPCPLDWRHVDEAQGLEPKDVLRLLPDAPASALALATDTFGHVALLEALEMATFPVRAAFVAHISGHVPTLAVDRWGCKVLQRVIELATRAQQMALAQELEHSVVWFSEHLYANFVLQKCVEQLEPRSLRFIAEELRGFVLRVSQHESGCRIMQRIFEFWPPEDFELLSSEVEQHIEMLSQNKYGKHVIMALLRCGTVCSRQRIVHEVAARVLPLACHKHSSHVVEACVEAVHLPEARLESERLDLMGVFCRSHSFGVGSPVLEMARDVHGAYVVRKILQHLSECQGRALLNAIGAVSPGGHCTDNSQPAAKLSAWAT